MLAPDQQARVTAALAVAERNAAEADQLAAGPSSYVRSAWAWLLGASNGASTNAANTRHLVDTLEAKAAGWRASAGTVEEAELLDFEQAAGASSNEATQAQAELLTPSEAFRQTFGPIASPSTWPPWLRTALLWGAVAVAALVVLPHVVAAVLRSLAGGRK